MLFFSQDVMDLMEPMKTCRAELVFFALQQWFLQVAAHIYFEQTLHIQYADLKKVQF